MRRLQRNQTVLSNETKRIQLGFLHLAFHILTQCTALTPFIRGGIRVRERRPYGFMGMQRACFTKPVPVKLICRIAKLRAAGFAAAAKKPPQGRSLASR